MAGFAFGNTIASPYVNFNSSSLGVANLGSGVAGVVATGSLNLTNLTASWNAAPVGHQHRWLGSK